MIVPCLWFQGDLDAALERYTSLFPDSEVLSRDRIQAGDDEVLLAEWRMLGTEFRAISQRTDFSFNESMSLSVTCADQAEVDRYWDGLIAGGGEESMCGWLKDPFGLSWQIVPAEMFELFSDPDPRRAEAARNCMLGQRRIVVAELRAAADAATEAAVTS
jgi:predicted 3-demethylubiquinone-9 3-methyltransferase (glyoxalase superfamily)